MRVTDTRSQGPIFIFDVVFGAECREPALAFIEPAEQDFDEAAGQTVLKVHEELEPTIFQGAAFFEESAEGRQIRNSIEIGKRLRNEMPGTGISPPAEPAGPPL